MPLNLRRYALYLRALLPSWRFFELPGPAYCAEWRASEGTSEWGPWNEALPPRPLAPLWKRFFLDARGNERLALWGLVDAALVDGAEWSEMARSSDESFEETISYRLLERLIVESVRRQVPTATRFQFRVKDAEQEYLRSRETEMPSYD